MTVVRPCNVRGTVPRIGGRLNFDPCITEREVVVFSFGFAAFFGLQYQFYHVHTSLILRYCTSTKVPVVSISGMSISELQRRASFLVPAPVFKFGKIHFMCVHPT